MDTVRNVKSQGPEVNPSYQYSARACIPPFPRVPLHSTTMLGGRKGVGLSSNSFQRELAGERWRHLLFLNAVKVRLRTQQDRLADHGDRSQRAPVDFIHG